MQACANTASLRVHEISEARAQRARDEAEGAAFRALTTDTATFLDAVEGIFDVLADGHMTEAQIRDEESRSLFQRPAKTEARVKRAARAQAAIRALQGIIVNNAYNRAQSDHERALALFLEDVTASWTRSEIERRAEAA